MAERKVLENCRTSVDQWIMRIGDLLFIVQQVQKASYGHRQPHAIFLSFFLIFFLFYDKLSS